MLIIRGNTRVADIFVTEFMRLFNHFESRNNYNRMSIEDYREFRFLKPDDSWTEPYFETGSKQWNERRLFAGKGKHL